jgi:hypothetical protein
MNLLAFTMNTPRNAESPRLPSRAPAIKLSSTLRWLASGLVLGAAANISSATTYSWINAKITTWSDTTGWSGGVAPTSDLDNIITFSSSQNTTGTNDLGPMMLNRLTATNSSSTNKNLNITGTSGNALNFVTNSTNDLPTLAIANNAATGPLTISIPFTVTNALTVTNSGAKGASISGAITNTAGMTFDGTGDGAITLGSGITSGAGGITMSGSYTLNLTGNNSYTGVTKVTSGTLALGNNNRIADTSALVMDGGTFSTGGFNETLGTLTVTANSVIDLGGAATSATLVFADSSSMTWTASIGLSFVNFTEGVDTIRIGTTAGGLTGDQLAAITINGSAAVIDANGFLTASPVPEPSSYALILGGIALLPVALRRRRSGA